MWLLFARAPPPDAPYWPGRRWLAAVDAVVWPGLLLLGLMHLPASGGLVAALSMALAVLSATRRLYTALLTNHRYRFTTWRWGGLLMWLVMLGLLLKLALGR